MLDAWIIEEMKRRERDRERQREQDRPVLQLPVPDPSMHRAPRRPRDEDDEPTGSRVIVIDIA
jgi:hypothetical protein